jgi:hypothetical protein
MLFCRVQATKAAIVLQSVSNNDTKISLLCGVSRVANASVLLHETRDDTTSMDLLSDVCLLSSIDDMCIAHRVLLGGGEFYKFS